MNRASSFLSRNSEFLATDDFIPSCCGRNTLHALTTTGDSTMKTHQHWLSALALSAALGLPTPALAATGNVYGPIVGVLASSDPQPAPASGLLYGGCMVFTSATFPATLNCPANWISFGCDGTFAAKDAASLMYDQAQLAWATKRWASIFIDDSKKINGYCVANRIDLW